MKFLLQNQSLVFLVFVVFLVFFFVVRIWKLHPLYVNPTTRTSVEQTLRSVTNDHGWLLSDIDVQAVSANQIVIHHQPHRRGVDPTECFTIALTPDHQLDPCDATD